jgi:hypothetical protein
MLGPSQGIADIECELMDYCLKREGVWWANHFFRNKKVNDLYAKLRSKSLEELRNEGIIT